MNGRFAFERFFVLLITVLYREKPSDFYTLDGLVMLTSDVFFIGGYLAKSVPERRRLEFVIKFILLVYEVLSFDGPYV